MDAQVNVGDGVAHHIIVKVLQIADFLENSQRFIENSGRKLRPVHRFSVRKRVIFLLLLLHFLFILVFCELGMKLHIFLTLRLQKLIQISRLYGILRNLNNSRKLSINLFDIFVFTSNIFDHVILEASLLFVLF